MQKRALALFSLLVLGCSAPTITSFSLMADQTDLKPGDVVVINTVQVATGPLSRFATFSIESGGEGGSIDIVNGTATRFTASSALSEQVKVVLKGVSSVDPSKTATLELTVTPDLVKRIDITASAAAIGPEQSTDLTAAVVGLGVFSSEVVWSLESAGGTLSANTGTTVAYRASGVVVGTAVKVKATSKSTPSVSAVFTVKVTELPVIKSFEATPASIGLMGGMATLSWVATEAETFEVSPDVGMVAANGVSVSVTKPTVFTLTAKNGLGSVSKTLTVRVENQGQKQWIEQEGTPGYDRAYLLATDVSGHLYVGGTASDSNNTLSSNDAWVSQYDSTGKRLWRISVASNGTAVPGSGSDTLSGLGVDGFGNVYLAGTTNGTFDIGRPSRGDDFWLAKFNAAGERQWLQQIGTAGRETLFGLAVDSAGNSVITGVTDSAVVAGGSMGGVDVVLARFDAAGTQSWIRQFGSPSTEGVGKPLLTASGDVFVVGDTLGSMGANANLGVYDAWVAKYDAAGNQQWLKQIGTDATDSVVALALSANDTVTLLGRTNGNFAGQPLGGLVDAYVAQFDATTGAQKWVRQLGSGSDDEPSALAVDSLGNVLAVGNSYGQFPGTTRVGGQDVFVAKYDSAGARVWIRQFGSNTIDTARSLLVDSFGTLYLAGSTEGALSTTASSGEEDAFVAAVDTNGVVTRVSQFGSSSADRATAISLLPNGNLCVVGTTAGKIGGRPSEGQDDAFVTVLR